jgi:hypothetical protein
MGQPYITYETFWPIYLQLLRRFYASHSARDIAGLLEAHEETMRRVEEDEIPLLSGLRPLRFGDNVIGPLGDDASQQYPPHPVDYHQDHTSSTATPAPEYAAFTDSEDSETNDESVE